MRLIALLAAALMSAAVQAQDYPSKPIRFIVPYPTGGLTDVLARAIGDPIGCLARVDRLPEGARERVRGRNSQIIFGFR